MNALIVVFSPYGNTLKVGKEIQKQLQENQISSQLINISRNKLYCQDPLKFIQNLKPHDLLFIGGPVYAHTVPECLINFISRLPITDSDYGPFAIPFVTYGGVSSGMALHDLAQSLISRGRKNIMGLKINGFHSLSQCFEKKVNENLPGDEIKPLIHNLIKNLKKLDLNSIDDRSYSFLYQENYSRPNKPQFKEIRIKKDLCRLCLKCIHACPVQRIERSEQGIVFNQNQCIFCGECHFHCPFQAVDWNLEDFRNFLEKVAASGVPLRESAPYSGIYPLNKEN